MKCLVLSDTHDRVDVVKRILGKELPNVELILHAGDLVHPDSMRMFADVEVPVFYSMGNNEEGMEEELILAGQAMGIHVALDICTLTIAGKKVAMTHLPSTAEHLAQKHIYDIIIFGHTHRQKLVQKNPLIFNPGDVQGRFGDPAYAVLDTEAMAVRFETISPREKVFHFED